MARNQAYREAENKIEAARQSGATELDLSADWDNPDEQKLIKLPESLWELTQLQSLDLRYNQLATVPDKIGQLTQLRELNLSGNQLTAVPDTIGKLTQLQTLNLSGNQLTAVPHTIGKLAQLQWLALSTNQLTAIPETIGQLTELQDVFLYRNEIEQLPESVIRLVKLLYLDLGDNQLIKLPELLNHLTKLECLRLYDNKLTDLPPSLVQLDHLKELNLNRNPLNPELAAAYEEGLDAVKAYLRSKVGAQIRLNEAKLILVGEGEVGKTCLMDALEGVPWEEHPTTHGIEIRTIAATDPESGIEISLNGWDFGGQRVYRPTHQLFFSAPAVYLVVWKPREGPQAGAVKEWIKLIKHREPVAKIFVVATHGGPQQRQPDIDHQELWDLFGKDTVLDFFHVNSKPDVNGERRGIGELKRAIARIAAKLPEMGREVPKSFQEARQTLANTGAAYLPLYKVYDICRQHEMDDEVAHLFVTISHRLGHLIHYEHDPALRDIVILKPNWLATAISFVLDDKVVRDAQGIVPFTRLSELWNDPTREADERYPPNIHPLFLRLMERFDLSYKVALPDEAPDAIGFWQQVKGIFQKATKQNEGLKHIRYTSLIAQLVPSVRPEQRLAEVWPPVVAAGDSQQMQICRIVDEKGQSAPAEGLFYQLIVRLHRYSLGRAYYHDSVHWQRGLILDNDYNGMARLEHVGNDVYITVRAPYPEGFLQRLTGDVKYLVESFWEGLRCDVMVPCIAPCGREKPGTGLYEVSKLIGSKRKNRPEYPCSVCGEWQNIDSLLRNAPAARPLPSNVIDNREVLAEVRDLRGSIEQLKTGQAILLSQADAYYNRIIQVFSDEAKEGPRLFSLVPVDRRKFNPREWVSAKFRLTLWCEHSRKPLPVINGANSTAGVYEIELTRTWFKKAAPILKVMTGTLSLILPVTLPSVKLALDDDAYEAIEEQLDFSKSVIDVSLSGTEQIGNWLGSSGEVSLEHGEMVRAQGGVLRQLQAWIKDKDPSFGGLVRVRNKRQEFLWVHEQFEGEY